MEEEHILTVQRSLPAKAAVGILNDVAEEDSMAKNIHWHASARIMNLPWEITDGDSSVSTDLPPG